MPARPPPPPPPCPSQPPNQLDFQNADRRRPLAASALRKTTRLCRTPTRAAPPNLTGVEFDYGSARNPERRAAVEPSPGKANSCGGCIAKPNDAKQVLARQAPASMPNP